MSELKQINQSELQVGKLYCDTPRLLGFNTVIMRYIGKIKGSHNFKYISGKSEYINEGDDIIRLAHHKKEPNWYWEVPKKNADVIDEAVSSTQNQHLLIVHHESGDEIHFNVIDYSLYPQIEKIINDGLNTQEQIENMLNIIYNNTLEDLMCQTYVLEDYTKIGKYNIVKCVHLPELGS